MASFLQCLNFNNLTPVNDLQYKRIGCDYSILQT